MKAMKVHDYGQIWCRRGASWFICHESMSNALPLCRPKIVFVSLLACCDLLGALGASAGRRRRVVGDLVSVHVSLPVPCQSAVVPRRRPCRLHVVGSAWADMVCVGFLVGRLERRRKHVTFVAAWLASRDASNGARASGFALWALCYVPHTSLFSSCHFERQ